MWAAEIDQLKLPVITVWLSDHGELVMQLVAAGEARVADALLMQVF